ncbi:MAG: 4Fe-4S binding protein [Bacteroidales bacterium]|nr:4Fe-4S binding protein [Bacteroidales bacterium]MBN2820420.1 4Fe-4S binding protein [Bacteroidales bacterium]
MDNQKYLRNVSTLAYDASKCIGCRVCIDVCPHNVFRMEKKKAEIIDRDKCMECGACTTNCITGALQVNKGVGCATAVIYSFFSGGEATCGCSDTSCC